jgi:hypothetical protein
MTGTHRHLIEHDDQRGAIDHHHGFGEAILPATAVIIDLAAPDARDQLLAALDQLDTRKDVDA